ncbi:PIG-L deacetylase family protein [Propionibacteriaceae bacterium Y2011]|uniref:PIG-L deacetylase family protein n=1 Tax=Microlunatus sp. Y2014 TaxID=3418488 RepID=UPI003B449D6D
MADSELTPFPTDWRRAVVFVAHPDDPEYGMAAAVARWTEEGRQVDYVLATSGEVGIEGMPPEVAGPIREDEQRRSAAIVGVTDVIFLGIGDGQVRNDQATRSLISTEITQREADMVITLYRGPGWAPDQPNHPDHINFGVAVAEAVAGLPAEQRPRWLFESSPEPSHLQAVTRDQMALAVHSLAAHEEYLKVLDPQTPVIEQARAQVQRMCLPADDPDGEPRVGFTTLPAD